MTVTVRVPTHAPRRIPEQPRVDCLDHSLTARRMRPAAPRQAAFWLLLAILCLFSVASIRAVRGERCGAGVALRRRRQLADAAAGERPGVVPPTARSAVTAGRPLLPETRWPSAYLELLAPAGSSRRPSRSWAKPLSSAAAAVASAELTRQIRLARCWQLFLNSTVISLPAKRAGERIRRPEAVPARQRFPRSCPAGGLPSLTGVPRQGTALAADHGFGEGDRAEAGCAGGDGDGTGHGDLGVKGG
jgi:hypothetical protein